MLENYDATLTLVPRVRGWGYKMKAGSVVRLALIPILMVGLLVYFENSSNRPDLIKPILGCFRGAGSLRAIKIVASPNGFITLQGQDIKYDVNEDKLGLSLVPSKRIVFDRNLPSHLMIVSGTPLLLRLSADRSGLTIPGDEPGPIFEREPCGGATMVR